MPIIEKEQETKRRGESYQWLQYQLKRCQSRSMAESSVEENIEEKEVCKQQRLLFKGRKKIHTICFRISNYSHHPQRSKNDEEWLEEQTSFIERNID